MSMKRNPSGSPASCESSAIHGSLIHSEKRNQSDASVVAMMNFALTNM